VASAIVFAYHDVGVRCLQVLLAGGVDVKLVVTHRDDPKESIWFGSVEKLARQNGLDVAFDDDAGLEPRAASHAPDFIFSFYYRHMLPASVLAIARRGAYNMHGSLLPKYRGRVPVNWAILQGERETGATLHEMVEKPDAGRIVDQMAVPILPDDTALDVFRKVTVAAELVLHRSLPAIVAGTAKPRAQDLSKGSYFGARKPEDGRIDWSRPAAEIHNLVRAVAPPYPGAFCDVNGRRLGIHRTRVLPREPRPPPADPGITQTDHGLFARCGDGAALAILEWEWK
jgi:methionyl-tRNA formyltransferase